MKRAGQEWCSRAGAVMREGVGLFNTVLSAAEFNELYRQQQAVLGGVKEKSDAKDPGGNERRKIRTGDRRPDYPSESYRSLKEKEIAEFGEYRIMRMVLEAFRKDVKA